MSCLPVFHWGSCRLPVDPSPGGSITIQRGFVVRLVSTLSPVLIWQTRAVVSYSNMCELVSSRSWQTPADALWSISSSQFSETLSNRRRTSFRIVPVKPTPHVCCSWNPIACRNNPRAYRGQKAPSRRVRAAGWHRGQSSFCPAVRQRPGVCQTGGYGGEHSGCRYPNWDACSDGDTARWTRGLIRSRKACLGTERSIQSSYCCCYQGCVESRLNALWTGGGGYMSPTNPYLTVSVHMWLSGVWPSVCLYLDLSLFCCLWMQCISFEFYHI